MPTTTSDQVYVWVWLPEESDPVPAGVLERRGGSADMSFRYGNRYRERADAIALFDMPFDGPGWHPATANLGMPAAIRDASPDSWGRRVILQRLLPQADDTTELDEATYLLESGSNRLGALDFQRSASEYAERSESASLNDLVNAASLVEQGATLPDGLERALMWGTAIGGARPKALLEDGSRQLIAKFSTSTDIFDVVGAEAASIYLAERAGIPVSGARVVRSTGRKVLLLDRFDRVGGRRRMVVSGLTMLRLPEQFTPSGSYPELLDVLAREGVPDRRLGEQLFRRVVFNIAIGNTDDHLRNHAAFWDGNLLELTPAYDLSPMLRSGETAAQALAVTRSGDRSSRLEVLVGASADYGLSRGVAASVASEVVDSISAHWDDAADFGELAGQQKSLLFGRAFLNPGSVRGF